MRETRRMPKLIAAVLCVLLAGYVMFTPLGALRLAVALEGHPLTALTLDVTERPGAMTRYEDAKMYRVRGAGGCADDWTVKKYGALYLGESGIHV